MNKYTYFVEYLDKSITSDGTKFYSLASSGEHTKKEMMERFARYVKSHSLKMDGAKSKGILVDAKGYKVGTYNLSTQKL